MKNYALQIAYDGTTFLGWQKTSTGPSIETSLEAILTQIVQHPVTLQAASRTDRGVHAEGQWVNFLSEKELETAALQQSLNALLPQTIRVSSVQQMPLHFHPTLHALSKEYHYHITTGPFQMPFQRHFYWHVPYTLDIEKMRSASRHFVGTHDFSSLCNFRKNLNYPDKTRHIESLELLTPQENTLLFTVKGNHFLYKMVRNLVGTLVHVGLGKIEPDAIPAILQAGSRPAAGVTAPAHGLVLKKIYYPQEFQHGLSSLS